MKGKHWVAASIIVLIWLIAIYLSIRIVQCLLLSFIHSLAIINRFQENNLLSDNRLLLENFSVTVPTGSLFYGLLFGGTYTILDRKFIRPNFKWK
jgi:hypothetical protein